MGPAEHNRERHKSYDDNYTRSDYKNSFRSSRDGKDSANYSGKSKTQGNILLKMDVQRSGNKRESTMKETTFDRAPHIRIRGEPLHLRDISSWVANCTTRTEK